MGDLRVVLDAHHPGYRRTVNVRVEQPDPRAAEAEGAGQVDRPGGLPDPSLPGGDRDDLLDSRRDLVRLPPVEGRAHAGGHLQVHRGTAGEVANRLARQRVAAI